ncbi:DMP19 family protein [Phycicoccus avicenniae]|uniref:DMP19 family protein n=1 Tax=Phycicoccus avicenniae TaxID=2828860 RepID=UPI003D2A05A4
MSILDDIADSPREWTAALVIDQVLLHQYDEADRRRDPDLPTWLREILVICDLETQLQMDGLLGWLENRANEDLDLVADALSAIGLPTDAHLVREAAGIIDPRTLSEQNNSLPVHTVSSFRDRHGQVTPQDYERISEIQGKLFASAPDGLDIEALLIAHAHAGLRPERGANAFEVGEKRIDHP